MSELSAYTDCLDLPNAKKLLTFLQKPNVGGSWSDWSGEGGSEIEVKKEGLPASILKSFEVPAFCTSFKILAADRLISCNHQPREWIVGGVSFVLPEYGDSTGVSVQVVNRELSYPVRIGFGLNRDCKSYDATYDACSSFSLCFPKDKFQLKDLVFGAYPEKKFARKVVCDLRDRFGLPDEFSKGILHKHEHMDDEMGEFALDFDPCHYLNFKHIFSDLISHLLSESPHHSYNLLSSVGFGTTAKFSNNVQNVSPVIRDLLSCILNENDYSAYDLTYYPLGPRNWKDREKSRMKLEHSSAEQLGVATLGNGVVATVSLGIEQEGYVFYLNFKKDDDYIKFYHSKLFQKTKWHSGAE